ncbi:RNA polymerase sigma-70 factor [Roseisolibacter agri]|uniref:DNA-directed RNA polymerase sigma-70 factor n=1 Tax=Roseisolibacter agri TaxID=2014610 RepID=A0AA37Q9D4_9BACT|nr:RNA polymerase sigma-70 factor [Roseisolibacter agri]GLC27142.1 DNA-directed RNA polymerase sigma-70 factor [Roseisolibacter agri]
MPSSDPHGPPTPPALADAVARARAGDEAAFAALFHAHYAALCSFAVRYVHERALAEELVQELFAALWERRERFALRGGGASARAYLFAAVRNRALNLRARHAVERDWADAEGRADEITLHPSPPSADAALEQAELHARLNAAMASLPERCRLVMQLRWREQLSYADIATVMGISTKGVENQLARGLRALRGLLGER